MHRERQTTTTKRRGGRRRRRRRGRGARKRNKHFYLAFNICGPLMESWLSHWVIIAWFITLCIYIFTPVATLPGAWHYMISAGTGRSGASIL